MWTSADTEADRVEKSIQAVRHPFSPAVGKVCYYMMPDHRICGHTQEHTYHLIGCRNCGRRSWFLFRDGRCARCCNKQGATS